jgi:hypothetical protein
MRSRRECRTGGNRGFADGRAEAEWNYSTPEYHRSRPCPILENGTPMVGLLSRFNAAGSERGKLLARRSAPSARVQSIMAMDAWWRQCRFA